MRFNGKEYHVYNLVQLDDLLIVQKSTPYYCRIEFDECRDQLDFEDRDYLRGRARYEVYRLSDVNATDRYNRPRAQR